MTTKEEHGDGENPKTKQNKTKAVCPLFFWTGYSLFLLDTCLNNNEKRVLRASTEGQCLVSTPLPGRE